MAGRECYHCKQWIEEGEAHDCWTTTEAALTRDLSEDLQDAWERLRETALEFGDQRIYASHHSIMFSRKACYFFVRPKRHFLELCVFLGRVLNVPQVRRVDRTSKARIAHMIRIRHRDEVEAPITDWLREAYELQEVLEARKTSPTPESRIRKSRRRPTSTRPKKSQTGKSPRTSHRAKSRSPRSTSSHHARSTSRRRNARTRSKP